MEMQSKKFLIKDIALWSKADILKDKLVGFSSFCTDSRILKADSMFVALKDKQDGHHFIKEAYQKGCRVFLIENNIEKNILKDLMLLPGISLLQVASTFKALQDIAAAWRTLLPGKVVAISGSNGKTSTKYFTYQILKNYKKTYQSPLSFNNHLGLPLSLLEASTTDQCLILEMGMNHKGELKQLVKIAKPDMVLVTQVNQAHIANFNSLQEVADAKMELYKFAPKNAIGIFNQDDCFVKKMQTQYAVDTNKQHFCFGSEKNILNSGLSWQLKKHSILGLDFILTLHKEAKKINTDSVFAPIFGVHNINNIVAAISIAYVLGIKWTDILKTLPFLKTPWGRMQLLSTSNKAVVIFDAYNANPASFCAALESLENFLHKGKKIAIIGEMKELGAWSKKEHRNLALRMGKHFDNIVFVGEEEIFALTLKEINFKGQFTQSPSTENKKFKDCIQKIKLEHTKQDILFIKASRFFKFEIVLKQLKIDNINS